MPRTLTRRRTAKDTDAYTPADDEDEETTAQDEGDEDERPRARRGSRRSTGKSSRRSRLHTEDDEDDDEEDAEKPRSSRKRSEAPASGGKGWGSYNKQKSESGDFPENLKVTDEAILIKFLDDEPFYVYRQHWIERSGKKSFTCLSDNCPLCDELGDRPRLQVLFNVIDFTDADNPEVKVWTVGTRVAGALKNFAADKKTSPLNRENLYWSVSKSGKGSKTQYSINPVKERDLEEDWDIEPLTADDIEDFDGQAYDESIVQFQTRKQLREIVDEVLDED